MVLTKVTTPIIGWVASILGWVINAVYALLEAIGIPNIGLAIILFTIIVYMAMLPMQIKQQKFSKLNSIMQPEIQKIQDKYKNKKDQDSVMKQNEEINAVYQKYGVSPTGSCLQLLIQMPVLLALYQVIYRIPGYVTGIKEIFVGLADKVMSVEGFGNIIRTFMTDNSVTIYSIKSGTEIATKETVIDFLYGLQPAQMEAFSELPEFSSYASTFAQVSEQINKVNRFFVLDISENPMTIIKNGWAQGGSAGYLLIFAAILIPFLAWFTQYLNYKLMPQTSSNSNGEATAMEQSMKSMNTVMPIMSAVFCLSFPVGIGIYWIAGAVIRCIQQVVLNKKMENMDVEEYIRKNQEKMKQQMIKRGMDPEKINQQARMNVRNIQQQPKEKPGMTAEEKAEMRKKSTEYYKNTEYKPGSIASKANMVKKFDEKGKKK